MTGPEHTASCMDLNEGRRHLLETLAQWNSKKPLLVTGRVSYMRSGAKSMIDDALGSSDIPRFSEFSPNCTIEELEEGLILFNKVNPDCVIAVGGGSVIDMAKLISFFGSLGLSPRSYLADPTAARTDQSAVPVLAIPTTAGTGSEATHFSVLYRDDVKYSVADARLLPKAIALVPEFLKSISSYNAACTGMDALAQGIESFWATKATDESREYATESIKICLKWLRRSVGSPDDQSRRWMLQAAYLSGCAINISTTTAPHAMSYPLTSGYGLPHGHAVSATLPAVFRANASTTEADCNDPRGIEHVRSTMDELLSFLGANEAETAAQALESLISDIGLSNDWISSRALDVDELVTRVVKGVNVQRLTNNPRKLDERLLRSIAEDSFRSRQELG